MSEQVFVQGLTLDLDLEPGDVVAQAIVVVGVERADAPGMIPVIASSEGMSGITQRGLTSFAYDVARGMGGDPDE